MHCAKGQGASIYGRKFVLLNTNIGDQKLQKELTYGVDRFPVRHHAKAILKNSSPMKQRQSKSHHLLQFLLQCSQP